MPAIVITGYKQIDKALKALGPKVANKVVRQAMRAKLKEIVAPVVERESPKVSGALAASVKIRAGKRSRNKIRMAVVIGEDTFKGDRFYAAFQEFGTHDTPADPYASRAYHETSRPARDATIKSIAAGVQQEAKSR